jgi:succinate-semialdehyde dehydrogenase/glutarate-semialdehyde dehydrogenase
LAEQVQAGSVLVNEVLINGGITEAPFGGIKDSGFGRVMGEEGLRAMCHTKHICLERVKMPRKNPLGFPYTEKSYRFFNKALRVMYSSGGVFRRLSQFF